MVLDETEEDVDDVDDREETEGLDVLDETVDVFDVLLDTLVVEEDVDWDDFCVVVEVCLLLDLLVVLLALWLDLEVVLLALVDFLVVLLALVDLLVVLLALVFEVVVESVVEEDLLVVVDADNPCDLAVDCCGMAVASAAKAVTSTLIFMIAWVLDSQQTTRLLPQSGRDPTAQVSLHAGERHDIAQSSRNAP